MTTWCSAGIEADLDGFAINGLWLPPPPDGDALPDFSDSLSLGSIAPNGGVQAIIGTPLPPTWPPGNLLHYKKELIIKCFMRFLGDKEYFVTDKTLPVSRNSSICLQIFNISIGVVFRP